MERRNFLRALLGVAAATALPSEVWPFRKIFLPPAPRVWAGTNILRRVPDAVFRNTAMMFPSLTNNFVFVAKRGIFMLDDKDCVVQLTDSGPPTRMTGECFRPEDFLNGKT